MRHPGHLPLLRAGCSGQRCVRCRAAPCRESRHKGDAADGGSAARPSLGTTRGPSAPLLARLHRLPARPPPVGSQWRLGAARGLGAAGGGVPACARTPRDGRGARPRRAAGCDWVGAGPALRGSVRAARLGGERRGAGRQVRGGAAGGGRGGGVRHRYGRVRAGGGADDAGPGAVGDGRCGPGAALCLRVGDGRGPTGTGVRWGRTGPSSGR